MINEVRIKIAEFLGTPLVEKSYFFMDYWTFIHLFSGILLMGLIFKFFKEHNRRKKFIILFIAISFWETFEILSSWVIPEKKIDIIYDFIIVMLGGGFVHYFKK